ncbi:MAG: hypothetical protein NVV74_15765 [Magnetospirillum sp.]|nr:hypothetical protein [Magnetospirillum sp.]
MGGAVVHAEDADYGRFEVPVPTEKEARQGYRDFPPNAGEWNTREFWERQKQAVETPDQNGRDLLDRANYCEQVEERIDVYATNAMQYLIDRHMTFNGGYIPHNAYEHEQRNIQTIANVAYRGIRYAKYRGAHTTECDTIAADAAKKIDAVISKYP